jgi:hypothetical protein
MAEQEKATRTWSVVPRTVDDEDAGDPWLVEANRWWTVVARPGLPFDVRLRVGKAPDGRLVCTGLKVNSGGQGEDDTPETEITVRSLREIRLPEILKTLVEGWFENPTFAEAAGIHVPGVAERDRKTQAQPGRPGYDRAHFEHVAALYREALLRAPDNPYDYMMKAEYKSLPTIRRWVQRARDMGLLGKAIPGKAGEKPATTIEGS